MKDARRSLPLQIALRWCVFVVPLFALTAFVHSLALFKIEHQELLVALDGRTMRRMNLITFVDQHRSGVVGYVLLYLAVLTFCTWRRYPAWAAWLCFACLGAPCVVYASICATIANKLMFWVPSS